MKETKTTEKKFIRRIVLRLLICSLLLGATVLLLNSMKIDCNVTPPTTSYCEKYNIEELNGCVREGYTGTGFLGMRDFNTEYWVCEDYGRVARSCVDWGEPSPSNLTADWEYCK